MADCEDAEASELLAILLRRRRGVSLIPFKILMDHSFTNLFCVDCLDCMDPTSPMDLTHNLLKFVCFRFKFESCILLVVFKEYILLCYRVYWFKRKVQFSSL